jgi:hypothetical protein
MSSQYSTCVYRDGLLYGIHGREDVPPSELRCVAALDGTVRWAVPNFGVGHLLLVDDRILILRVDGTLLLIRASPVAYDVIAQATVSRRPTRALPALSQGRLLFRDNDPANRKGQLHCVVVADR